MPEHFKLFLFIAFILRLSLVLILPIEDGNSCYPAYNDEPLHFEYVRYMAFSSTPPVYDPKLGGVGNPTAEFTQPPLYYAFSAPIWRLGEYFHTGWGFYLIRLLSVLLGLLAALFVYKTGTIIWNDRTIAFNSFLIMLFMPGTILFTSIITNDALLICFSSLFFASFIASREQSAGWLRAFQTAVLMGISTWTKLSALLFIPLTILATPSGISQKVIWARRLMIFALVFSFTLPLLVWNWTQYNALFVESPGYGPKEVTQFTDGAVYHPVPALKYLLRSAAVPIDSLWGSWLEKLSSSLWIAFWLAVLGIGILLTAGKKDGGILLLAVAIVIIGFIARNINMFQVEFRALIPAFPALSLITAAGAGRIGLKPYQIAILAAFPLLVALLRI